MPQEGSASELASHSGASSSRCSSSSAHTYDSIATRSADGCKSGTNLPHDVLPRRPTTQPTKQLQAFEQPSPSEDVQDQNPSVPRVSDPQSNRFDSLQDLLEQAGYKDTRVITPQPKKLVDILTSKRDSFDSLCSEASPTVLRATREEDQGRHDRQRQAILSSNSKTASRSNAAANGQTPAVGTSWFSSFWKAAGGKPHFVPPSDVSGASRAHQKGTTSHTTPPPRLERSQSSPPRPLHADRPKAQKTLASKASTLSLWKGSRACIGIATKTPSLESSCPPQLATKGSLGHLRGGGNAASVGVGISAYDGGAAALSSLRRSASRSSLRSANGSATVDPPPGTESEGAFNPLVGGSTAAIEEWRRSLVQLKTSGQSTVVSSEGFMSDDVDTPPKLRLTSVTPGQVTVSKDLFGPLADPVVSSEAAVAPRNSECFKGPEARGLRHAKSVEALRSALNQKRKPGLKTSHSVIGQRASRWADEEEPPVPALPCFSSDASLASLLRDHQARTVYRDALPEPTDDEARESPVRARGPPVLTLTSPSGVHSPQIVKLEGKEFDPRTFSPPTSIESRMLVSQGTVPAQLRKFDELISASSHRGRSRSRASRKSAATDRASPDDDSRSGAESEPFCDSAAADEAALRRKTRRGCRAGKKHGRSMKNLAATAAADADCDNITSPIQGASAAAIDGQAAEPVSAPSIHSAESSTRSFGAASETIVTNESNQVKEDEEDPFIAHVKAQEEAKRSGVTTTIMASQKSTSSCRTSSPFQHPLPGMASILGGNGDDGHDHDENASPTDSTGRPLTPRSGKGRIIGRSRPTSGSSSNSSRSEQSRHSLGSQGQMPVAGRTRPAVVASAVPPRAMSSPTELAHQYNGSWDSPTKEVAQRIKKMRSRRF